MSAGQGVRSGKAYIELFLNSEALKAGLNGVSSALRSWGARLSIAGGVINGALTAAVTQTAAYGDAIANTAKRTGLSTDAVQELGFVLSQVGGSADDLEGIIKKMNAAILAGDSEAFAKLGLSVDELRRGSPEQAFLKIAEAIGSVSSHAERAAMITEIFGKSSSALFIAMANGTADISALRQQLRDIGGVMSGQDVQAASALSSAMSVLWTRVRVLTQQIAVPLIGAFTRMVDIASGTVQGLVEFIKANRETVLAVAALGVALTAAGTAAITLGAMLSAIPPIMAIVSAAVGALITAFGLLVSAAAALTPAGALAVALLGLLGAAAINMSGVVGGAASFIKSVFASLVDLAKQAMGGIADAMTSGNLELAAKIAWAGVTVVWMQALRKLFVELQAFAMRYELRMQQTFGLVGDKEAQQQNDQLEATIRAIRNAPSPAVNAAKEELEALIKEAEDAKKKFEEAKPKDVELPEIPAFPELKELRQRLTSQAVGLFRGEFAPLKFGTGGTPLEREMRRNGDLAENSFKELRKIRDVLENGQPVLVGAA